MADTTLPTGDEWEQFRQLERRGQEHQTRVRRKRTTRSAARKRRETRARAQQRCAVTECTARTIWRIAGVALCSEHFERYKELAAAPGTDRSTTPSTPRRPLGWRSSRGRARIPETPSPREPSQRDRLRELGARFNVERARERLDVSSDRGPQKSIAADWYAAERERRTRRGAP